MMEKIKILVLSKDRTLFKQITAALLAENIPKGEYAGDLTDGLALLKGYHPDVAFLDEEMCLLYPSDVIAELVHISPQTRFLLVSLPGRRDTIHTALAAGVADYILKPIVASEVTQAINRILNSAPSPVSSKPIPDTEQQGKVVTLFSTVGGVGKTTIAVNLATAISEITRKKVCLIDADLQFGDICRYLNLTPNYSLADYAKQGVALDKPINQYLEKWRQEIDVFAAGMNPEEAEFVTPEVMNTIIRDIRRKYNYIIIDTSIGFSDVALTTIDMADVLLYVGVLDTIPAVKNLKNGLSTLTSLGYRNKVKMILNRNKSKTAINVWEVEAVLGLKFAAMLPNDFATALSAVTTGLPFVIGRPDKELTRQILCLANAVVAGTLGEAQLKTKLAAFFGR